MSIEYLNIQLHTKYLISVSNNALWAEVKKKYVIPKACIY